MTTCNHELPKFDLSVTIDLGTFYSSIVDHVHEHNTNLTAGMMWQISVITTDKVEGGSAVDIVMGVFRSGKPALCRIVISVEEFKKHITSALVASGDHGHLNITPQIYDIASITLSTASFTGTIAQHLSVDIISPVLAGHIGKDQSMKN